MGEKMNEILGFTWRNGVIGIVAVNYPDSLPRGYWQAYIGVAQPIIVGGLTELKGTGPLGLSEQKQLEYIAALGDKLSWQEAQVFFPELNIKSYKTYPTVKRFEI